VHDSLEISGERGEELINVLVRPTRRKEKKTSET